jgi:hypothetical protein
MDKTNTKYTGDPAIRRGCPTLPEPSSVRSGCDSDDAYDSDACHRSWNRSQPTRCSWPGTSCRTSPLAPHLLWCSVMFTTGMLAPSVFFVKQFHVKLLTPPRVRTQGELSAQPCRPTKMEPSDARGSLERSHGRMGRRLLCPVAPGHLRDHRLYRAPLLRQPAWPGFLYFLLGFVGREQTC